MDNVSCKTFNIMSRPSEETPPGLVEGASTPRIGSSSQQQMSFMWVIAQQASKIEEDDNMEKQAPIIFNLNYYINGDLEHGFRQGIAYAPFKMAYVKFNCVII